MSTTNLEIMLQDTMEYISDHSSEFEILGLVIAIAVVVFTSMCLCCIYCRKPDRPRRSPFLQKNEPRKTGWDISPNLKRLQIGVNCNEWRLPRAKWGPGEPEKIMADVGDLDISRNDWGRATEAVDAVLGMLLQEIKKAALAFPKLQIGSFVRQGSSREGLKVCKADEFDALLLFGIEGINFKVDHLKDDDGWVLPEFGQLVAEGLTENRIRYGYQTLDNNEVFVFNRQISKVCLNSRNLHEKVFKSIIMKAANAVEKRVNRKDTYEYFAFAIEKFNINPPSVNIQIKLVEKDGYYDYGSHLRSCLRDESLVLQAAVETVIDVDIVPGLELGRDVVPDPRDWNKTMECPRYAVFKWFTDNQPSAILYDSPPNILWRLCSSGYEKHVLDVSRGSNEQSYIVTALRIMKREFRQRKANYRQTYPSLQVVTVLRSYHLKHIAFYCILYLTIMNKVKLSGVREALVYFLEFLEVGLSERRLPHFFQANPLLVYMFPEYKVDDNTLRYDLLSGKSSDALRQADKSFGDHLKYEIESRYCAGLCTYKEFPDAFREFVKSGKYYC